MQPQAAEDSLSRAAEEYGDPEKLRLPLSLGVTVAVAHLRLIRDGDIKIHRGGNPPGGKRRSTR
jgi:hypothetical protein